MPKPPKKPNKGTPKRSATTKTLEQAKATPTPEAKREALFTSLLLSPLIIGSVVATGLRAPHFALFSVTIFALIVSRHLGQLIRAGSGNTLRSASLYMLLLALLSTFAYLADSLEATLLLIPISLSLILFEVRRVVGPGSLTLQLVLICFSASLLPVLGIFCQVQELHLGTFVLGLPTGAMLAASYVAKHAALLESKGWVRKKIVGAPGKSPRSRPGLPAQLYATCLMVIPCLVIVFASLRFIPLALMAIVIAQLPAPKLATAFLNREIPDADVERNTLRLTVLNTGLMLIGGLFV